MLRFGLTLCLVTALVLAPGCKKKKVDETADPKVQGSGVGSFETRTLPPFTRVKVGGNLEVTINVGKSAPLELRGDDNLIKLVPSKVENGELLLVPDVALKKTQPLRLTLGAERLEGVTAVVASRVTVHGVKADAFEIKLGGAAYLTADGSASKLVVTAGKIARAELKAFSAGEAKVGAAELANVQLGYLEKLHATQRGNASISYAGTPELTSQADSPERVAPRR